MKRARGIVIAALFAAAVPTPASAATWSEPAEVGVSGVGGSGGRISYSDDGTLNSAYYRYYRPPGCEYHCNPPDEWAFTSRAPGAAWTEPVRLTPGGQNAGEFTPAAMRGQLIAGTIDEDGFDSFEPVGVGVYDGPRLHDIWRANRNSTGPVEVDMSQTGAPAVTWLAPDSSGSHYGLYVSRYANGRDAFERPIRLARNANWGTAAVNDKGDTVVVWSYKRVLYLCLARRGRPFGKTLSLGRVSPRDIAKAHVAIDEQRRVTIAFRDALPRDNRAWVLRSRSDAKRFTRYQLGRVPEYGSLDLARTDAGHLVVWRRPGGIGTTLVKGVRPGPILGVGQTGDTVTKVVALRDGRAAMLVERYPPAEWAVATTTAAGRFAQPEVVPVVSRRDEDDPDLALDPTTGQPTLLFARSGEISNPEQPDGTDSTYELFTTARIP